MFKPYKGLTQEQIDKIRAVYGTLKKIETVTQTPWQAIAGIWFRESFSVKPPKRPGGPFQFDPIPSSGALRGLLDRFTDLPIHEKERLVSYGVNDFYAGGVFAACFFRMKTKPMVFPGCPDETIKDAMWGYNGRAKYHGSADGSPYVMNGYDEDHYPLRIIGTVPDGHGGREHVNRPDEKPGAFTVYKQLKELFP